MSVEVDLLWQTFEHLTEKDDNERPAQYWGARHPDTMEVALSSAKADEEQPDFPAKDLFRSEETVSEVPQAEVPEEEEEEE